jgi:hypothetical protein
LKCANLHGAMLRFHLAKSKPPAKRRPLAPRSAGVPLSSPKNPQQNPPIPKKPAQNLHLLDTYIEEPLFPFPPFGIWP